MTFKEYVDGLVLFLKKNPHAADYIPYALADHGQEPEVIYFEPSLRCLSEDMEEISIESMEDEDKFNAVCVN